MKRKTHPFKNQNRKGGAPRREKTNSKSFRWLRVSHPPNRHGRSVEEEVREILRDATKREGKRSRKMGTEIAQLFRHDGLKPGEEIRELRGIEIQPADFKE